MLANKKKFKVPSLRLNPLTKAIVLVLCTNPMQSVLAQEQANTSVLEEIMITSRRYEESINDAPVAVAVMTEKSMEAARIQRADDIFNFTPGATWESFSKVQPVAAMRGLIAPTPGNSSSEASIQTVVDNVVITKDFMKSPPLFDLNRVEVLRGPQGTSFGRNASVGLVHFVTNRPDEETAGKITATLGTDELYEVSGFINGALSDTASGRLAFNIDGQDGATESISTGEGVDGDTNVALRGSLVLDPTDTFSAYLKLEYSQDRDEAPVRHGTNDCINNHDAASIQAAVDAGLTPYVGGIDTGTGPYQATYFDDCDPFKIEISDGYDFHLDRDILTFAAELTWDLNEDLSLTSITGYMDGDNDSLVDLIGSPNNVAFQKVTNDGNSFSQEFRIDNQGSGSSVRWLAGVYYLQDEEDRFEENQFQFDNARSAPFLPTAIATISNNETTSYSVFGEVTWDLSEKASLTYGGRYVTDDKDYTYGVSAYGSDRQIGGVPGVGSGIDGVDAVCAFTPAPSLCGDIDNPIGFSGEEVSDSWSDYISKLSFDYTISDSLTGYALYSEGFKSGTFQPDARSRETVNIIVKPETSTNFELGLKYATSKVRWTATVFQLEVDDVQTINQIVVGDGFTGLISNVGTISSTGLEVDGTFIVTDNLIIGGNFALIDAELQDTTDPEGVTYADTTLTSPSGDPTDFVDISGERPPGAPEWTYTLFSEYNVPLDGGSSIDFRVDLNSRSDVYNQTSSRVDSTTTVADARLRPEVTNVGGSIGWTSADENLNILLWGKNLNEDVDIENYGPPSPCCDTFAAGFRNKRSMGVTANYAF